MVDSFLKEFENPAAIPAGEVWTLQSNGSKLSEGFPERFIPVLGASVLNDSANAIRVMVNETSDNSFKVLANGSRPIEGIPMWDIEIKNLGASEIAANKISVVLFNDLEQVSRYNAYSKGRGF